MLMAGWGSEAPVTGCLPDACYTERVVNRLNDLFAEGPQTPPSAPSPQHLDPVPEDLVLLACEAFREGYTYAIGEHFGVLRQYTEEFLRQPPGQSDEQRALIRSFVEHLERRLKQTARDSGYVDGGLGI